MRTVFSVLLALTLAKPAPAAYDGMFLTYHDFEPGHKTVRVHAHFSSPTDQLLAVGGDRDIGVFRFEARSPLANFGGPFEGLKQEDFAQQPITGAADSFVTIGADGFVGNDTDYSPGFLSSDGVNSVIQGDSLFAADGAWFDTDPGTPALAGDDGLVLIAQFSFTEFLPSVFFMQGTVHWQPAPGDLHSEFFITGKPPAPSVVAVFVIAAMPGQRRRRARASA